MDPQRSTSFPPGGSPKLQWGSPALRPMASFPPRIGNRMTAVPNMMNTPPHRPPMPMGGMTFGSGSPQFARAPRSPQFARAPYPQPFRTPQPRQHSPSTPRHHWSADNRGNNKPRFPFQKVRVSNSKFIVQETQSMLIPV